MMVHGILTYVMIFNHVTASLSVKDVLQSLVGDGITYVMIFIHVTASMSVKDVLQSLVDDGVVY